MGVPVNYRKGTSVVATYNFIDLATGRGMTTFYGGDTSGAYLLTPYQWYSSAGSTGAQLTSHDVSFALKLEQPFIFDGDCVVNVPLLYFNTSGGSVTSYLHVQAILYKSVNGLSSTIITSGASTTQIIAGAGKAEQQMAAIKCTIPRTRFAAGEYFGINIKTAGFGGDKYLSIGHDPKNRLDILADYNQLAGADGGWDMCSQMSATIPVVIDL